MFATATEPICGALSDARQTVRSASTCCFLRERHARRYPVIVPFRVAASGRDVVNWFGQTRYIGTCGVAFVIPRRLPIGQTIEYVVTLASCCPASEIYRIGTVLRCARKYGDYWYETAATAERCVLFSSEGTGPLSDGELLVRAIQAISAPDPPATVSSFLRREAGVSRIRETLRQRPAGRSTAYPGLQSRETNSPVRGCASARVLPNSSATQSVL
jgi:hypothetical protein